MQSFVTCVKISSVTHLSFVITQLLCVRNPCPKCRMNSVLKHVFLKPFVVELVVGMCVTIKEENVFAFPTKREN